MFIIVHLNIVTITDQKTQLKGRNKKGICLSNRKPTSYRKRHEQQQSVSSTPKKSNRELGLDDHPYSKKIRLLTPIARTSTSNNTESNSSDGIFKYEDGLPRGTET